MRGVPILNPSRFLTQDKDCSERTLACRVARLMRPLLESQQKAQQGKPNGNFAGFAGDAGLSCVQSARDLA